MTLEGPNYDVKELSGCALNVSDDLSQTIIGTLYAQGQQKNTLLLFLNTYQLGKGLIVYNIKLDEKKTLNPQQNSNGLYYQVVFDEYSNGKIFILKEYGLLKIDKYSFYNFEIENQGENDNSKVIFQSNIDQDIEDPKELLAIYKNKMIIIDPATQNLELSELVVDVKQNKSYFGKLQQMKPPIIQSTYNFLKDYDYGMIKDGSILATDNFFICQDQQTIYFFNIETFSINCKIINAPQLCKFLKTENNELYIIAKSNLDQKLDNILHFNIFQDKKLLSLNQKEKIQKFIKSGKAEPDDEEIKQLVNNLNQYYDQENDLPQEFQLSSNTCVVFNFIKPRVELFLQQDMINLKGWTILQNNLHAQKNLLESLNQAHFLDFLIKDSKNLLECFYFDKVNRQSILHQVLDKPLIFKNIIDGFIAMKETEFPFLMFKDKNGKTPLDLAIQGNQYFNIQQLLKLMIYHKSAAEMQNSLIDKNLIKLIEIELDLKELFESEILFHPVDLQNAEDTNKNSYLYPTLFQSEEEILNNKGLIVNSKNRLLISEDQEQDNQQTEENDQLIKYSVNYYLIDMKQSLTNFSIGNNGKSLMQVLKKQSRDEIFEFPCIQNIIEYKWRAYTRNEYQQQFKWFSALFLVFYLSLFAQRAITEEESGQETLVFASLDFGYLSIYANIVLTVTCSLIALRFFVFEIKQIQKSASLSEYLSDLWNLNDVSLLIMLPLYCFLSVTQIIALDSIIMKSLKCLIIFTLFMKINYYLRVFETFSFLVSMLQNVFIQLKAFLTFFMIVIIAFSCLIQVLLPESSVKNYDGTGMFAYMMLSLRTAIGDFTFDSYQADEMKQVTWLVWLTLMIVGNIVFMNFIIAVVNDSYAISMRMKNASQYRLKVEFIVECENQFTKEVHIDSVNAQWEIDIKNQKQIIDGNGENEQNQNDSMQYLIYQPKYLIVQTLSTGIERVNDPLIISKEIQNSIQDVKRTQILLENKIDRIQEDNNRFQLENQEKMKKIEELLLRSIEKNQKQY